MLAIDRDAADTGQQMRDDNGIAVRKIGHNGRRHDQGERVQSQAAGLDRLRPPAQEIALGALDGQPVGQGLQEGRPCLACGIGDDDTPRLISLHCKEKNDFS